MIIYIAGPMSGIKDFNRPLFNMVAAELSEQGHSALNPATLPDGLTQQQYMQICLPMVVVADELVMLPGWERSEGAYIEFLLAKKSGKTIRGWEGGFCMKAIKEMAMSNETDLDWLARNVHHWAIDHAKTISYSTEFGSERYGDGLPYPKYTKDQWLARRAELQNKPSWKDAPEWATFLSQSLSGAWYWHEFKPETGSCLHFNVKGKYTMQLAGEVIGDWRDTLEKRPEEFKPSIEEANRLGKEFKAFTSIENSQQQKIKQDNGWFERGELPPVGTVCEYTLGANAPWYQCEIKYVIPGDGVVMKRIPCGDEQYCGLFHRQSVSFRPIRTEREMAIDEMMKVAATNWGNLEDCCEALYLAGYRKESK